MKRLFGIAFVIISVLIGIFYNVGAKEALKKEITMTTYCVGRNTIELPMAFKSASVFTGVFKNLEATTQDPSFDVVVNTNSFNKKSFSQEMNKRRQELKENSDENVDVFRFERAVSDEAVVFRVQKIDDAYVSEINFLRGENLITVKLDSFRNQYVAAERSLERFSSVIRDNSDGSIDGQPQAFCLGPVAIIDNFKEERGSFLFKTDEGADFEIEINTFSPDASTPLLFRIEGEDSLLKKFNINHKVLRRGERRVANMRAQEWLGWAKLSDGKDAKSLQFVLETMRSTPSRTMPGITLTFNTGKPLPGGGTAKTTISDDEAIQLWDKVVNSIQTPMR